MISVTPYTLDDVNAWFQAIQYRFGPAQDVIGIVAGLNAGFFTAQSAQNQIINDEYTSKYVDPVINLYKAVLGRYPDHVGAQKYIAGLASNALTVYQVAGELSQSAEAATRFDNTSNAALIQMLYQNILDRAPSPAETAYYEAVLSIGTSRAAVINMFAQSPEFTSTHAQEIAQFRAEQITSGTSPTPTDTIYSAADINAWYQSIQFRDGPAATVASYVDLLNSYAITAQQVQQSIESDAFCANYVSPIVRLYQAAFNRIPDNDGEDRWVDLAASGESIQNIANGFANSPEFLALHGVNASAPMNAALLTSFYQNILGRAPDTAGFSYWLNSGQNVGQVLNQFAQSSEFKLITAESVPNFLAAQLNHSVPPYAVSLDYFATTHQDTTAPTASVFSATIAPSGGAVVQSSEAGGAYLVKDTVNVTNVASILGAGDQNFNAVAIAAANKNTTLSATGLAEGVYKVYTVDASGNLSAAATNLVTVDTTAPTLTASTPSDNATGVAVGANIVLAFSVAVKAGTGSIQIFNTDTGALVETIAANSSRAQFHGSAVTITPTANLDQGTSYYVKVDNAAITDIAGNAYAGISNPTALNFRTANAPSTPAPAPDTTPPTMVSAAVSSDGLSVVITYSESLTGPAEATDYGFSVSGNYLGSLSGAAIGSGQNANQVTLTMSTPIPQGATVSDLMYFPSAGVQDSTKDLALNPAVYGHLNTLTNNSTFILDITAPTISAFSVASDTTLSVTSSESGTAQLYDGATAIGSVTTLLAAATPYTIGVVQQISVKTAALKVFDAALNVATDSTDVILGTSANDALFGTADADFIFGFDGGDILEGAGGADKLVGGNGGDQFLFGSTLGSSSESNSSGYDSIIDFTVNDYIAAILNAVNHFDASSSSYVITNQSTDENLLILSLRGNSSGSDADALVIGIGNYNRVSAASQVSYNISGTSGADSLTGGDIWDYLTGGAGIDQLHGGNGTDALSIAATTDDAVGELYDGGNGTDDYLYISGTTVVDLRDDTVTNIEILNMSGSSSAQNLTLLASQLAGFTLSVSADSSDSMTVYNMTGGAMSASGGGDTFIWGDTDNGMNRISGFNRYVDKLRFDFVLNQGSDGAAVTTVDGTNDLSASSLLYTGFGVSSFAQAGKAAYALYLGIGSFDATASGILNTTSGIDFAIATEANILANIEAALENTSDGGGVGIVSRLNGSGVINGAAGTDIVFLLDDGGGDTAVVRYQEGGSVEADYAGELTLLGVIVGNTGGDFNPSWNSNIYALFA